MKLVFNSGEGNENFEIDKMMLKFLAPNNPQITYIPCESSDSDIYFQDFIKQYQRFRVKKFIHMPIDIPIMSPILEQAFNSDIIHLSGGNTFYFLKHLKKNKMLHKLKTFVRQGGILTGSSAGAIIMTPNIRTASFPAFNCDENDVSIRNLTAMSLVGFEFFPHYKNSKRYDQELITYSINNKTPIFACPDGAGIIINGNKSMACGKLTCFHQGKKLFFNK